MLRGLLVVVRLALFLAALVSFLLARVFLGPTNVSDVGLLGRSFALSFLAALGVFLCLVALWTFRVEENVRRLFVRRLLLARAVFALILLACVLSLVAMSLVPVLGEALTAAGIVVALAGMAATFLQPKPSSAAKPGPRYP